MSELAQTLAAFADLDLKGTYAGSVAAILRDRLDLGAAAERESALIVIDRLEARATPEPSGWFPGAGATAL